MNWPTLYSETIVDEPACWKTCNGGFCCSNNHPDFQFNFINQNGTEIIYLPREYEWAQAERKTFENQREVKPMVLKFDFDGFSLGIVYFRCSLMGLCEGVIDKPLLCRLYPNLPVFGYERSFETVEFGSIFDVTFAAADHVGRSPCTVLSAKEKYASVYSDPAISSKFDTYTIFYIRVVRHLAAQMREHIGSNERLSKVSGPDFWRTWEMLHLGGRLVNKTELTALIEQEYRDAQLADPSFDLSEEAALIDRLKA